MNFLNNFSHLLLDESDSSEEEEGGGTNDGGGKEPKEEKEGEGNDSDSDSDDESLIPEAVWGALAVARGKFAEVAKHTVATVKRDLNEFKDSVKEEAWAASEHTAHVNGRVNDSEFRADLTATAHDAFEATTDVLEGVGQKVEKFGSSMFRGAGQGRDCGLAPHALCTRT
jgi:hypothetical protein